MKLKNIALLPLIISGTAFANPINLCQHNNCFVIDPATLKVELKQGDKETPISAAQAKQNFKIISQDKKELDFTRDNINIEFKLNNDALNVSFKNSQKLTRTDNKTITFPIIRGEKSFLLPMLEGWDIPSENKKWIKYLTSTTSEKDPLAGIARLSMQFLTAGFGKSAIYYQINNSFDNTFWFTGKDKLALHFKHTFNILNKDKPFGFTIKELKNDPAVIAKTYRQHKIDQGKFVTLAEKAKIVPGVTKLYGAPFIYLWGDELIGESNINWKGLQNFVKQQLASKSDNPTKYFNKILKEHSNNSLEEFAKQKWLYAALKSDVDNALKELIKDPTLWNKQEFNSIKLNSTTAKLISAQKTPANTIKLNKYLIQSAYSKYIVPVPQWGNGVSVWMIKQLQSIGLKNAWLGLNDVTDGLYHTNVIDQAKKAGYLIAPYDSYNSLQQQGARGSWSTGVFYSKKDLFKDAAIIKQNGKYVTGFLGRGHELNSSYAMPQVKRRLNRDINMYNAKFNSWFFDSDGAGALYNDFSTKHPMSQAQDVQNKINYFKWAAKHYNLVVGTEDGKDYIAPVAVYGQGLVSQGIWDKDMRQHKKSKYYMGDYWSPLGVPPRYTKPTPLKPLISYIYYNPTFEVPLYQMVYNNSIITSDHWEYATFKFPSQIKNNILKTFLYNYPPLLHLDRKAWAQQKKLLSKYLPVWSKWHKILVQQRMTNFSYLSKDKLLQSTQFSNGVTVIANFADSTKDYNKISIPAKSVVILQNNKIAQRFTATSFE
ncbi:glycoside hydrolase [Francisella sp. 19X1-34]|uniref:glycoside hydrolase n=1 Tax=Francisella sp. 19X1-34 TaxID=3087177 RepID=UPI002E2F4C93|nr:glycoside hydrolase [Francisella sp. 19X1-34]MED7789629.1 glycoside hydrolase [Francisella sp. 19X1-34]